MRRDTFFEGLMLSLSQEQKDTIRNSDAPYINFYISVFNAGVVVNIEPTETPMEESVNGYDVTLSTDDVLLLLEKYHL